jgi:hypothetical protein
MDTSTFLCSGMSIQMSLTSVIQTRTFCLWDNSPILSRLSSFDDGDDPMLEQHNRLTLQNFYNFFTIVKLFEESAENLDVIESREYDDIEIQGIKNSLRIFLQGTEAILPDRWETLFSLEGDYTRAFSPCKRNTHNVLNSSTTYNERLDSGIIHRASFRANSFCAMGWRTSGFFCFYS